MCIKDLDKLEDSGLIKIEEGYLVKPNGRYYHIQYCVHYIFCVFYIFPYLFTTETF